MSGPDQQKTTLSERGPAHESESDHTPAIDELFRDLLVDLNRAGFHAPDGLVQRYLASLLTKRFVILTGVTGSGKTKLAQVVASWFSSRSQANEHSQARPQLPSQQSESCVGRQWLPVGAEIPSDRVLYHVDAVDSLAVQFSNVRDGNQRVKVTLPKGLIDEWVSAIDRYGFTRATTPARTIREQVAKTTSYSMQLNSFETHLKAAAFAMIEMQEAREDPDGLEVSTQESAPEIDSTPHVGEDEEYESSTYKVVAVGSDWNSSESILGYPDALQPNRYVRTPTLDLILRATEHPEVPHFLILDEMNLSHVERYFSDILSSMESGEPIDLYSSDSDSSEGDYRDEVPASISLPDNLFIIGTVNVDETTYLFSPKVLDRANTIEFRVSSDAIESFLENPTTIDLGQLYGQGERFAPFFMGAARGELSWNSDELQVQANTEIALVFAVMADHGNEFGFRTALEMCRFIKHFQTLSSRADDLERAIDAQIYQKVLPRLSGSRARLEPVLHSLLMLCRHERQWEPDRAGNPKLVNRAAILASVRAASESPQFVPSEMSVAGGDSSLSVPIYPLSESKIVRMLQLLQQNGFTSFAEA